MVDKVKEQAPTLHVVFEGNRRVLAYVVLRRLLATVRALYNIWRAKTVLNDQQIAQHASLVADFRRCWVSLQWKPTVWVHWMCAHAHFFIVQYRSLGAFSSIPVEHRHQRYKRDLRHAFMGWRVGSPQLAGGWLRRVIESDALDQGLHYLNVNGLRLTRTILPPKRPAVKRKRQE